MPRIHCRARWRGVGLQPDIVLAHGTGSDVGGHLSWRRRLCRVISRLYIVSASQDEWIFTSERGTQMATDSFASRLKAAADRAGIASVHSRALRHACGHVLAVRGRDTRLLGEWLGHRNLQNTALYTDGVSARFRGSGIELASPAPGWCVFRGWAPRPAFRLPEPILGDDSGALRRGG
jgi:hypothetical protein